MHGNIAASFQAADLGNKCDLTKGVRAARERGCGALIRAQRSTGRWEEYNLPVGVSDEWMTAFIALTLAEASPHEDMPTPVLRAYEHLIKNRTRAAGFGYNRFVEPDADSTATVLLLEQAIGVSSAAPDFDFLEGLVQSDGGIATFYRSDGWGKSHACVTPVAALALAQAGRKPSDLADYSASKRTADGGWPNYWWQGPFYATAAWLRLIARFPDVAEASPRLLTWPIETVFDLALAVEIAALWRLDGYETLRNALIVHQLPDGRWPPSKTLRVTNETALDEASATGPLFGDMNGLMTTALAVRALSILEDHFS